MKDSKYPLNLYEQVRRMKRKVAEEAIKAFKGNKKQAALAIGVSRAHLYDILRGGNEKTIRGNRSRA